MFIGLSAFNITGFNRTFMELKFVREYVFTQVTIRFNRTFMELKCILLLTVIHCLFCFNRTFMELKFRYRLW